MGMLVCPIVAIAGLLFLVAIDTHYSHKKQDNRRSTRQPSVAAYRRI